MGNAIAELATTESATIERISFDEERSMLGALTRSGTLSRSRSLADSLPPFELQADVFSETTIDVRGRRWSWVPGAAEVGALGRILWASPWSLWGLALGFVALMTGGGVQRSGRMVEFWGGFLPYFLKYFPFIAGSPVSTFGHVVLGRTRRHLEACRPHQRIHVRQYECWGPLFVPVYLAWWFALWCVGKRPYYDNPFEREAFDATLDEWSAS